MPAAVGSITLVLSQNNTIVREARTPAATGSRAAGRCRSPGKWTIKPRLTVGSGPRTIRKHRMVAEGPGDEPGDDEGRCPGYPEIPDNCRRLQIAVVKGAPAEV